MFADLSPADQAKYVAAKRAVELVEDGNMFQFEAEK